MENQFTVLVLIKSSGNSWQSLRYGLCDLWREIIKMYIHSQGTSGEIRIVTAVAAAFCQVPGLQLSSGLGCSSLASSVSCGNSLGYWCQLENTCWGWCRGAAKAVRNGGADVLSKDQVILWPWGDVGLLGLLREVVWVASLECAHLRRQIQHPQVCPITWPWEKCFPKGLALTGQMKWKPFAPATKLQGKLSFSHMKWLQSLCHAPVCDTSERKAGLSNSLDSYSWIAFCYCFWPAKSA